MCDTCYELFDSSFNQHDCPKYRCEGYIVEIDSDIAWQVSLINKSLKKQKLPVRTNFCCSGHYPKDTQAYIGFSFSDEYLSEDIIEYYMQDFINNILKSPADKLNNILSSSSLITVKKPYKTSIDILPRRVTEEYPDWERYRVFVNDLSFKYSSSLHTELDRCHAITFIQSAFKDFLIDCIESINKNTPKDMKIGEWM